MGLYRRLARPLLHLLEPETSHDVALRLIGVVQRIPGGTAAIARAFRFQDQGLEIRWKGLTFRSPVGLAAGADKNARGPKAFEALGFGFIEVGTVTPRPQPGNPKPRVFRLPDRLALVNRLGFPSMGAEAVARNLARLRDRDIPIGVSIGKNAWTPIDRAVDDYLACLEALYAEADYFTVNVSSPNTEGLTTLQARESLLRLTSALLERRQTLAGERGKMAPLLVKISPDLSEQELRHAVETCVANGVDGLVAVNTSTDPELRDARSATLSGGISGKPIREKALRTVEAARSLSPPDFFIVGVGGVFSAKDAWRLLQGGANAVQVYTGLIYRGPGLVRDLNRGLLRLMADSNAASVGEAASASGT